MIQVICPECKGKGKVPCPVCREDSKNIVDCRDDKESQEKECPECGGTGEVLCTACMGGGIMDTNAFA